MTTRSVEELRRQLHRRPEFQPRIREAIPSPIARVPARRTFQDFVPDYAQAAGASSLPSRAADALSMRRFMPRTPDYVQAARMAAGADAPAAEKPFAPWGPVDPPSRVIPIAPRPAVQNTVPDYVQAARIADRRDPIHDLKPVDQFGIGVRSPSVPAGVAPHRYLGLNTDYTHAQFHGPDDLVPNPANKEMFGQLTPQRVMRRRQQLPAGSRPSDFFGFRNELYVHPVWNQGPNELVPNPVNYEPWYGSPIEQARTTDYIFGGPTGRGPGYIDYLNRLFPGGIPQRYL